MPTQPYERGHDLNTVVTKGGAEAVVYRSPRGTTVRVGFVIKGRETSVAMTPAQALEFALTVTLKSGSASTAAAVRRIRSKKKR